MADNAAPNQPGKDLVKANRAFRTPNELVPLMWLSAADLLPEGVGPLEGLTMRCGRCHRMHFCNRTSAWLVAYKEDPGKTHFISRCPYEDCGRRTVDRSEAYLIGALTYGYAPLLHGIAPPDICRVYRRAMDPTDAQLLVLAQAKVMASGRIAPPGEDVGDTPFAHSQPKGVTVRCPDCHRLFVSRSGSIVTYSREPQHTHLQVTCTWTHNRRDHPVIVTARDDALQLAWKVLGYEAIVEGAEAPPHIRDIIASERGADLGRVGATAIQRLIHRTKLSVLGNKLLATLGDMAA